MVIDKEDTTLTHLLGYLRPKHWADALKYEELDKDLIKELIKIQEDRYCYELMSDVEEVKRE